MHKYFVAYLESHPHGYSVGNAEVTFPRPITRLDDIREIGRYLADQRRTSTSQLTVTGLFPLQG